MSRTTETRANAALAIPRKLLDGYLREAAARLAQRRDIVGTRIREAREAKGWLQKELAGRVHVEPQTISNWERSVTTPDFEKLQILAEVLGCEVSFFVSESAEDGSENPISPERFAALEANVDRILALLEPPDAPADQGSATKPPA
jgi:transcriptional regulator with XRE-family HTH domain